MLQPEARRGLDVVRFAIARNPPPAKLTCTSLEGDEQRARHGVKLERVGLQLDRGREERYASRSERDPTRDFRLPDDVARRLVPSLGNGRPLWLDFHDAWLACLPWERWLQPLHQAPVLRVPYFDFQPSPRRSERLEVLVCSSTPAAKEIFAVPELLARTIGEVGAALPAFFHVFVDRYHHPEVAQQLAGFVAAGQAHVHSQDSAQSYGEAPRLRTVHDTGALESPWLRWMLDVLPSRHVDYALFLCHGYRADGVGALAFAESPLADVDPRWARFVGPGQLGTFLDRVGASLLALVSPPGNFSLAGSLALADDIAHRRPGEVVAVDLERDRGQSTLGQVLAFLAGRLPQPPGAPSLSLYCHPQRLSPPRARLRSALPRMVAPSLEGLAAASEREPERWAAASQRILERHVAQHASLPESRTEIGAATRTGQEEALKFVADLLGTASGRATGGGGDEP